MTDLRDAAKLALKVLENKCDPDHEAIAVLKRALADDISQQRVDKAEEQRHEPVAMRWDFDGYGYRYIDSGSGSNWQTRVKDAEPLYDRPQVREWAGLKEEEIELVCVKCAASAHQHDDISFARAIEAKLKEKNHGVG